MATTYVGNSKGVFSFPQDIEPYKNVTFHMSV